MHHILLLGDVKYLILLLKLYTSHTSNCAPLFPRGKHLILPFVTSQAIAWLLVLDLLVFPDAVYLCSYKVRWSMMITISVKTIRTKVIFLVIFDEDTMFEQDIHSHTHMYD